MKDLVKASGKEKLKIDRHGNRWRYILKNPVQHVGFIIGKDVTVLFS